MGNNLKKERKMTSPLAPKSTFATVDTAVVLSTYNQQTYDIAASDAAVVKMTCVLESGKVTFGGTSAVALFVTAQSFWTGSAAKGTTWWSPKWSTTDGSYLNIIADRSSGAGTVSTKTTATDMWTAEKQAKITGNVAFTNTNGSVGFTAAWRDAAEDGWNSQTLNGYRVAGTTTDTWTDLKLTDTVSFIGGFKSWTSSAAKSSQNSQSTSQMTEALTYTFVEQASAVALVVSLAATSAVSSLSF